MKIVDCLNYCDFTDWRYQPLFDDLSDHVGVLSVEEAKMISTYMEIFRDKEGIWMSYPDDPLDNSINVERNGGEDGLYEWSGLLHYLVEKYRVDPPGEFREHVATQVTSGADLQTQAEKLIILKLERAKKRRPPR
ncbi:MAG: hypothetical protein AAFN80_18060, partial [Pseudomonadota bacterium]